MRCQECQLPYHLKCSGLSTKNYQQAKSNTGFSWICNLCLLATLPVYLSFSSDFSENNTPTLQLSHANMDGRQEIANADSLPDTLQRTKEAHEILFIHLNVNSLQNKVEEVGLLIKESKAQVVFLTKTKINRTYPDSQFAEWLLYLQERSQKKGRRCDGVHFRQITLQTACSAKKIHYDQASGYSI